MSVGDSKRTGSSKACAADGDADGAKSREPLGIPIPKSVSAPSFYVATFALGVVIGIAIALYWRP
jgi:hypothetical protein